MSGSRDSLSPDGEPSHALPPGSRLGKYEIRRLLGAGGMGAVYEAVHTEIGKRVAIKVLAPELAVAPGARARFLREAQLASKINHPNIVDVNDMGNEDGRAFIVMEFLDGEDLSARLERTGPMPVDQLVDIMLPVCSAVAEAHRLGITHRDLKPQNIFLANGPRGVEPKVLDFGISKGNDSKPGALTGTGMIGTPFYFAPEQILDAGSAGPASDQYALGVILYECLTGRRPYEADNLFLVFQAIVDGNAPQVGSLRPDLPMSLQEVVSRSMHKAPTARFGSAAGLGRALLPFASARVRSSWEHSFAEVGPSVAATMVAPPNGPPPALGVTPPPRAVPATTPMPRTPMPRTPPPPAVTPMPSGGTVVLPPSRASGGRFPAFSTGTTDVDLRPRRRLGPILAVVGVLGVGGAVAALVLGNGGQARRDTVQAAPVHHVPATVEPPPLPPSPPPPPHAVEPEPPPPPVASVVKVEPPPVEHKKWPIAAPSHKKEPAHAHHDRAPAGPAPAPHAPSETPRVTNPNAAPILE